MIVALLMGVVFGVVGTLIQDASYGVSYYIHDTKKLNSLIEEEKVSNLVEICLNGNGSLSESSLISNVEFDNDMLDDIYALEKNISASEKELSNYELVSVNEAGKIYSDYEEKLKSNTIQLKNALDSIRKYVDSSVSGSLTSSAIFDAWEINSKDCPSGYTLISPKKLRVLVEEFKPSCLVITEWTEEEISTRYSSIQPAEVKTNALKYFESITNFMKEHGTFMDGVKNKNEEFKTDFKDITNEEVKILEGVSETIKPIRETFEEIVGDDSIFKMLNCGFLRRDLNKVIEQLYESFGGDLKSSSRLFIAVTIMECILSLFILTLLSRYKDETQMEKDAMARQNGLAMEMTGLREK